MKHPFLKAAVIGAGNLAWSLIPNLQAAGVSVVQLISRSSDALAEYGKTFSIPQCSSHPEDLRADLDLIFLSVSDQAIEPIAQQLSQQALSDYLCVHTSGSTSIDALRTLAPRIGVFYPMQTFTRGTVKDYTNIPLFLEGNESVMEVLRPLALRLSQQVFELNSPERMRLHLGAVLVCNFTNYLYQVASKQLPKAEGLDFHIYEPLIREHIEKVFRLQPEHSQTGPAIRGDQITVEKHLQALAEHPHIRELYRSLSMGINPALIAQKP